MHRGKMCVTAAVTARRSRTVAALVVVLLGSLTMAGTATAGTGASARLSVVVAAVAGRPVTVSCETSRVVWPREVASAHLAAGAVAYYDPDADAIRFGPLICSDLLRPGRGASMSAVRGMFIAAHEAAHARGIEEEGTANCWAVYWAQALARRFNGVSFFTIGSRQVLARAKQIQRDSPAEYRRGCKI